MPRLLTGDKFFSLVDEDTETRKRTVANKVARKDIRDGYTVAMAEWRVGDEARKQWIRDKEAWKQVCADVDARKAAAKA
jgi:hypothetical protein